MLIGTNQNGSVA